MARSSITKSFADRGISSSTILIPDELVPLFSGDPNQLSVSGALRNQNIIPMEVTLVPPRLNKNQTTGSVASDIINISALRREADVRNQLVINTLAITNPRLTTKTVADETGAPVGTFAEDSFGFQANSQTVGRASLQFNNDALVSSAESLQRKIAAIKSLPPLIFLINPSTFEQSYNKKIDEQMARQGWIPEHWGDELATLSISGSIGAAIVSGYGLTRFHRRDSAAFKNLMHLFLVYRNNGYIFEDNDKRRISSVGSVRISYDSTEYLGSFDDLSITESSEKPFNLTYQFGFTVRQRFDVGET